MQICLAYAAGSFSGDGFFLPCVQTIFVLTSGHNFSQYSAHSDQNGLCLHQDSILTRRKTRATILQTLMQICRYICIAFAKDVLNINRKALNTSKLNFNANFFLIFPPQYIMITLHVEKYNGYFLKHLNSTSQSSILLRQ